MKRWLPFLLIICVVLLLPAVSVAARAADTSGTCGDNLTWTFEEETGTLTIDGIGPMWDWEAIGVPWYSHRSSIKSVAIGNSVTSIGDLAFLNCNRLTRVNVGDSVTYIGNYAFAACLNLFEITIPDSVTYIGDYAFSACLKLEITIPDSVTYIGDLAFLNCHLIEITIPDSVTYIGDFAFSANSLLTAIHVNENNAQYCSVDGVLFDKPQRTLIRYPNNKPGTIYTIPDSVTTIGDCAFDKCSSLTEVTIPDSVTSIGERAFASCYDLSQVIIPNSVTSIEARAFSDCDNLTKVTIGDSVTTIGDEAFYNCKSLTEVTIPDSVTTIGDNAFIYSSSLTAIYVNENNVQYSSIDGVLFDKLQRTLIWYPQKKPGTIYTIPGSVTSIGNYAFNWCTNLTQVTIPDSVTSIGEYAFESCLNLDDVTIPNSVTTIGDRAFSYCTSLTKMAIPGSVTSIGDGAFHWCSQLTEVTIPDSVTSIGDSVFSSCRSLTKVTIPNSVTSIGEYAFAVCDSLTDVYYIGTEAQWDAIDIANYNDPLQNATIHYAFDTTTGAVSIPTLPEGAESALIAAYGEGKLLCAVTGKVGNDNYIPLAIQPDEIRIFYLGSKYQPVTAPDIIRLD